MPRNPGVKQLRPRRHRPSGGAKGSSSAVAMGGRNGVQDAALRFYGEDRDSEYQIRPRSVFVMAFVFIAVVVSLHAFNIYFRSLHSSAAPAL